MADETPILRRCVGSERFGIAPHDAPIEDFPKQPSQKKDGLGRMCKTHWNEYTAGLARDAKARKAAAAEGVVAESEAASPVEPMAARKRKRATLPPTRVVGSQGDAG